MSLTSFLSKSRGPKNLLHRMGAVSTRFGITSKKFDNMLYKYNAIAHDLGCVPTLPVTAVVLKRHPKIISKLSKNGIEFAVHGYIHCDYGVLPLEEQAVHFGKAIDTFKDCSVTFTGFRAPFLRINDQTMEALGSCQFAYDSSYSIHWDVIDRAKYSKQLWNAYDKLFDFYRPRDAEKYLALPRRLNGLVEIPVSIPDDEGMVERLGIKDAREISEVWKAILHSTYERGELFTISLHPERIFLCESALTDVFQQARQLNPSVWVATLREIAEWWKERERFVFEISPLSDDRCKVRANCSERATILLRNCRVNVPVNAWSKGYKSVSSRDFILESSARPVVGVALDSSPAAVAFLNSEGFIVERSDRPGDYGIYFSNLAKFAEVDEMVLSRKLEQSAAPLLRYWRWPNGARSALSVTGDIDSMTLTDFALRILENWRQNRRQRSNGAKAAV